MPPLTPPPPPPPKKKKKLLLPCQFLSDGWPYELTTSFGWESVRLIPRDLVYVCIVLHLVFSDSAVYIICKC